MSLWKQYFHWNVLLAWNFLGWVIGILLAIGGLMVFFEQYTGANICFVVTSLFIFAKIAQITIYSHGGTLERLLFAFILCGLLGTATIEAVRGVSHWAQSRSGNGAPPNSNKPEVAVPTELHNREQVVPGSFRTATGVSEAQPSRTAESALEVSPIDKLSELGWTVEPGVRDIVFRISAKPLPDMRSSAKYLREIQKPFRLSLQQVSSVAGVSFLRETNDFVGLEIGASDLQDISELRGLTSLRTLVVSQTPFTVRHELDISAISSLPNLETVGLYGSMVSDLGPLRGLTKLSTLNIGGTLVRDLTPIKGLVQLRSLDVRDSGVTDLTPLSGDVSLEELSVDGKQVPSLAQLKDLPKFSKLTIISQVQFDMTAVGTLSDLRSLSIWGPAVMDVSPLRSLSKLTSLQIGGLLFPAGLCQVQGVDAIANLAQLKTLSLEELDIASLPFLVKLRNLVELNLQGVPVAAIPEIANLSALKRVSLVQVPVVDISPLLSLPSLAQLSLLRTPARADVISQLERRGVKVTIN